MGSQGRSGRRTLAAVPKDFSLPDMGDDETSIRSYIRAVNNAVVLGPGRGGVDPRVADTLLQGAGMALRALRDEKDRGKNERLARLEKIVSDLELAGIANEVAERQHKNG